MEELEVPAEVEVEQVEKAPTVAPAAPVIRMVKMALITKIQHPVVTAAMVLTVVTRAQTAHEHGVVQYISVKTAKSISRIL